MITVHSFFFALIVMSFRRRGSIRLLFTSFSRDELLLVNCSTDGFAYITKLSFPYEKALLTYLGYIFKNEPSPWYSYISVFPFMKFYPDLFWVTHSPLLSQTPRQRWTMFEFITFYPSLLTNWTGMLMFLSL